MKVLRPVGRRASSVVVSGVAVAAAASLAAVLGGAPTLNWDIAWTAAALAALAGTVAARAATTGADRRRWSLWSIGALSWLIGQLAWDVFDITGFPASPNVADVAWWGFALAVLWSMISVAPGRGMRWISGVESIGLIAAAMALCAAMLEPEVRNSALALAPKVSALIYPLLYVSAAVLTLQALIGGAWPGVRRASLQIVLAGIAIQAIAFIVWSYALLEGKGTSNSHLLAPLWVIGLAAIAIGSLLVARSPGAPRPAAEPSYRGALLPGALFVALLGSLVVARIDRAHMATTISLEIGLMCCGASLIARSMLLSHRLRRLLERERAALSSLAEREAELARLNVQLVADSRRDPLTGLFNRRALAEDLPALEALRAEDGTRIAVALCDADRFKAYNDRFGHLAGDQALRAIAAAIRGSLRAGDTAYRFGGEELLLILRDADEADALRVAERIRGAVAGAALPHPDSPSGLLTVSVGVAAGGGELGALIARADAAVYEAKRTGRNRVAAAGEQATLPPRIRATRPAADDPVPRSARGMLGIARAGASGEGALPVLEAVADVIHTELSFETVAVNLREPDGHRMTVVVVQGEREAREALLGTTTTWSEWETLIECGEERHGAIWLPAGSYEDENEAASWVPPVVPALCPDAWQPDDMLLLPLRGADGRVLAIVSVDQPLLGRRPDDNEIAVLMAVIDHAAFALEAAYRDELSQDESRELRLAAMMLLAQTLDLRDPATAQHSRMVGEYARQIAGALALAPERVERIGAAGVLHDLGKVGIADAVLHKAATLTDEEWRDMRRHPHVGALILEHAGMPDIAGWVACHHERPDGRGYPHGLSGASIPLEARILAVADAFEAMTGERPYAAARSESEAIDELRRVAGEQFDEEVVEALAAAVARTPSPVAA